MKVRITTLGRMCRAFDSVAEKAAATYGCRGHRSAVDGLLFPSRSPGHMIANCYLAVPYHTHCCGPPWQCHLSAMIDSHASSAMVLPAKPTAMSWQCHGHVK